MELDNLNEFCQECFQVKDLGRCADCRIEKERQRLIVETMKHQQMRDCSTPGYNQIEEQLDLVTKILDISNEGIMITDQDGRILSVNPSFTAVTGYGEHEVIGNRPSILQSGRQDALFYINMWASIHETGQWQGEIYNRRKNGEIYPEWLTIISIKNKAGNETHYVAVFTDITDRKQYEEQIQYQAHHDALTGLPNRLLFQNRLSLLLGQARKEKMLLTLLFLDVDRLKSINDSVGHIIGDQLLQGVAERLKTFLRAGDAIARMGGDEFALLLHQYEEHDVVKIVREVLETLNKSLFIGDMEFFLTASIGVSLYPTDGNNPENLIQHANTAMYRAKELGGNNFQFYTPAMNAKAVERQALETSLHKALDREEFILYYQPQVSLKNGQIVGMEALLRWQHPALGLIPPAEFIPLAEETGLIVPIGEWVLRKACQQNLSWHHAGFPSLRVGVNLSTRQFQQKDLVKRIADILGETNLPAHYLDLEITESMAMQNPGRAVRMLQELKSLGIHLSIDDFGTGYSSLGYLSRFPIDTLKIDRSFVQDIPFNLDNCAIITTIITLAKSLQMNVIAEGVDAQNQLAFLQNNGCNEIQGYLFSHPVSPVEVETLFTQESKTILKIG